MNARLKDYFSENDYLRTDVAATLGDSRAILSRLVADGELQRIAQGVYALPDTLADELAVIAGRSKNIVFSHETALALHGLHNRHPPEPPVRSDPLHITLFGPPLRAQLWSLPIFLERKCAAPA